ncbi:MAG: hypothetical protein IPO45_09005 [Saprospiraceae bacterium]|nr:hypothetical protein [Candidatus Brachybacter algidus]
MNKLYILLFIMFSMQINVSAQKKTDLKLASSIEGYYSGFYISKKKIEKNSATLFLESDKEVIKVNESIFGPFQFKVKYADTDTLFFISSIKEMKIKYIKSSKRITFISLVDNQIVNFNAKYSHKDDADLKNKILENEAKLASKKESIKYYGKFYGTLKIEDGIGSLDTIIVTQVNKKHIDGNLIIQDKYAMISSYNNNFKPFETPLKITNSGLLILANNNADLTFRLNYDNKTLYFVHKANGLRFEGIEVEGQTK